MTTIQKCLYAIIVSLLTIDQIAFASEMSWIQHMGPVYCNSDVLCMEHCSTISVQNKGKMYPCCKQVHGEGTHYPTCHCCTDSDACNLLAVSSTGCEDCTQVISKYTLAYVDRKCPRKSAKREDATMTNIWSDPTAKIQPQPRKFSTAFETA